jgi:hypothetical protein
VTLFELRPAPEHEPAFRAAGWVPRALFYAPTAEAARALAACGAECGRCAGGDRSRCVWRDPRVTTARALGIVELG